MSGRNLECDPSGDTGPINQWTKSIFLFRKQKRIPVIVRLDRETLQIDVVGNGNKKDSDLIPISQVASCQIASKEEVSGSKKCCKATHSTLDNEVYLQVVKYGGKEGHTHKIKRSTVNFLINTFDDHEENLREAGLIQSSINSAVQSGLAYPKSVLFVLNPKSGKGQTLKIFYGKVKPILDDFQMKYDVLITKYANHASEFVQNQPNLADHYSSIVTISGDGLLFEVLNGFADLLSQASQLPIPLGIIPGGSGNALAHSINSNYLNGNKSTNEILDCTMHVIHGKAMPMDIVKVITPNKHYYSFLSVGWGLLADIDIESESWRFLGEPRFTLWSLYRSFALRKNRATLSYLPKENCTTSTEMPSLDQPVPDSWITITSSFVLVYAAYQKYLNSTLKFAPDSKLDDETIYLLYIKDDVSVWQVIQFLLTLEDGLHMKLPFVHFLPVSAFRLVPESGDDIITIDGELIPCSPLQTQVIPKVASILSRS